MEYTILEPTPARLLEGSEPLNCQGELRTNFGQAMHIADHLHSHSDIH